MTYRDSKSRAQNVLSVIKQEKEIFIFDTETMGFNPKTNQIIQFSGARYSIDAETLEMKEIDWVDTYINPEKPIPDKIKELTGITDGLVSNYDNESILGPQIINYLEKQKLVATYNITFDEKMVKGMAERIGYTINMPPSLDILTMARDLISKDDCESHKLASVTKYLYPEDNTQFHSAIEDVRATAKVMQKLLLMYNEALQEEPTSLVKLHLEWASYSINPRKQSEVRIKINIDKDQEHYGDIFWDVRNHCWSCKKTKEAQQLFATSDLSDLERQVLERYGRKYSADNMDDLAKNWGKAKREQKES